MRNEYAWHQELVLEKTTKEMEEYLKKYGFTDAGIELVKKEGNLITAYNNIKKLNGEQYVK